MASSKKRVSRVRRKSRKIKRSRRKHSRRSRTRSRSRSRSRVEANRDMSMERLKRIAKSNGIPFGGLRKTQLINKINRYT